MKPVHQKIRRLCAILLGLAFLASGLLKLLDPVGTGLIVKEYFHFFRLGFLSGAARWTGVALSLAETLVGAALVTGVFRHATAVATQVLLGLFTFVTVVLVIVNPSMDCGCFGEAIHLTHGESLVKNLILLGLAAVAFLPYKEYGKPAAKKYVAFGAVAAALLLAAVYNQFHLPTVDFTDFAPGSELFAAGEAEEADIFETHIYERGGQRGMFSANRLPDSTWTFVRKDTVNRNTLSLSSSAPVLSFSDTEGEYRDEMAVEGKVVVLSVYDPDCMDWQGLPAFFEEVYAVGARPLLLTTAPDAVPPQLRETAFMADYKTLITLNRSNGGATYLADGLIVRKWHARALPASEELAYFAGLDPIDGAVRTVNDGRLRAQGFLLYVLAVLLLL